MLNLDELNFDDAMDFYEQMQIDEILMYEHEMDQFNFHLEDERLQVLFPNQINV